MKATTKYFGDISYEQEDILHIPDGLFGFEEKQEYLLIHFKENDSILLCLQNLEDENLAFIVTSPFYILPDYNPEVLEEDMKTLNLTEDSEVSFYNICVIHDLLEESTVNLRCPVVINPMARTARQIILEDTSLSFKHPLNSAVKDKKEESHC